MREKLSSNKKGLLIIFLILLALPITVVLVLTQQNFQKDASEPTDLRIEVSPGIINADINNGAVPISALIYDSSNNPYSEQALYNWSISSTDTVGSLTNVSGNITEFIPLNVGCGDLTVGARTGAGTVLKTISVAVSDGSNIPSCGVDPTPTVSPIGGTSRVFITSISYRGNLGGLIGADAKCQERASAGRLGGTWKAWLSDNNISASSRLLHNIGEYKLLTGEVVASNWEDLTDGTLNAKINIDELRQVKGFNDTFIWTNTKFDGSVRAQSSCDNWSSNSAPEGGFMGHADSISKGWTESSQRGCNVETALICFEQIKVTDPTPTAINTPTPFFTPVPTSTPVPTVVPTATPIPQVSTVNLIATEDSFVRSKRPNRNYGTKSFLATSKKFDLISYMKFDVSSTQDKIIEKATLRIKVLKKSKSKRARSKNNQSVKIVDNDWTEREINYNNKPDEGTLVTDFKGKSYGQVIDVDVTSAVRSGAEDDISFSIDSDGKDFFAIYSRDSKKFKPTLIVEYTE